MPYKVHLIDGIAERECSTLVRAGIRNTADLLRRCANPAGRRSVAADTGLTEERLLEWVHVADLMQISGIGVDYAELLEAIGVKTREDLSRQDPHELAMRMREVNRMRAFARALPSPHRVARWIAEASDLPAAISA